MRRRFPASLVATGGALAVVIALLKLVSVFGAGQTSTKAGLPATTADSGAAFKTTWGEPDLQGIWTYEYQIPLQRPDKYAGKEFFTDAEIAELDKQRAAQQRLDYRAARGSAA